MGKTAKTASTTSEPGSESSVSAVDFGPVVSGNSGSKKRLLVALGVVLIVGAGTAVILAFVHNKSNENQVRPKTALGFQVTGDNSGAQQLLDSQIASAKTDTEKGQLYEQKATISYQEKKYQDSLDFAQKAETLHPTPSSAGLIADAELALGKKSEALKYYKLQLQRSGMSGNRDSYDRMQAKIKSLEAN